MVLAWLRSRDIVPVLGVSQPGQLDEALAAMTLQLDDDTVARLEKARRDGAVTPADGT